MSNGLNNMSINMKINGLMCVFIGMFVISGLINYKAIHGLGRHLDNVAKVQMPAVRTMTLVDMMHDGMRAIVYRAMLNSDNTGIHVEIKSELEDFTNQIDDYFNTLDQLALSAETKKSIGDVRPTFDEYVSVSQ